ncbi:chemotaxis protein CheA [Pradoshia sp. D12]|uniref:chemotaxis protein CheA n=1 Tax=Bacillaceae TaxID=186817 RepID=UPI00111CB8A8|nr:MULTISPECIES: chemotaxis protein CheA [Bacillaceae]QFK73232.1 chemotaxis protein CheA [Pradoshia sp. D12]TPF73773.1 chemotaxis protein CheA [Bacillus sp. D12]
MDLDQYLEVFIEESKEHLQTCNELLLELEKNPDDVMIVHEIFRSAHTLKGMSATMGFDDLARLTHQMENVLDEIRNQRIKVNTDILDIVFLAVDDLEAMVLSVADGGNGKRDVSLTIEKLENIVAGQIVMIGSADREHPGAPVEMESRADIYDEYEWAVMEQSIDQGFKAYSVKVILNDDCILKAVRVFMVYEIFAELGEVIKSVPPVDVLEEEDFGQEFTATILSKQSAIDIEQRILKVSELESVRVSLVPNKTSKDQEYKATKDLENANQLQVHSTKQVKGKEDEKASSVNTAVAHSKTIRVNIERLDILMNLFEELVIDRGRLEQISKDLKDAELFETVEHMTRISGDMQTIILNMRMVPVETVFNRFPRMVRQLARNLNKHIRLEIIGAETELDRTVIDEIGDPLLHLLRNALDHGIETPEARRDKGKPEEGTVILKAYHSGNHVFIEIEDDGAGINTDVVVTKAVDKGIITEEQAEIMTERQKNELLFASGFSTAKEISDISGRGVGLDVVKNTIESLGGSVSINSRLGYGSIFSVKLPLTLSIISVMLVEVQDEKYAIPLSSIIETYIVQREEVLRSHNQDVIDFRGKIIPLVYLHSILSIPVCREEEDFLSLVIVRNGDKMAGLVVNSFIGQQEIVLKSLGNYLNSVFAVSGATILGDGQVALIIDCNSLVK